MAKDITEYIKELNILRVQLAENLCSKGVDANENEGFETLIPKILDAKSDSSLNSYGSPSPLGCFANLIYALSSNTCKTGEFILTEALGTEVGMTIETGLEIINGFAIWVEDFASADMNTEHDYTTFGTFFVVDGSIFATFRLGVKYKKPNYDAGDGTAPLARATTTIDGGNILVIPKYNKNSLYTPFVPNYKYRWVAW